MLSYFWNKTSPISRLTYIKCLFLNHILLFLTMAPMIVIENYEKNGVQISTLISLLCVLLFLFGFILFVILSFKTIFNRAIDIEGKQNINRLEWFFLVT